MTVLAGVHEQYQGSSATTPEATLQRFPKTAVTREFAASPIKPQSIVAKLKNLCQEVWDAGLVAAVSFKLTPDEVFNGQWKPYLQAAAAWLKDNGHEADTIFIIWHEPENDVPKWFTGAAQFALYFNKVHDWLKSAAPNLLTCHAALGYQYADKNMGTSSKPDMQPINIDDEEAVAWGKTKADIKCIDIYSGRSFPLGTILPELTGFKRWLTHTVGGTATYGVTERGWMADTAAEYDLRATTVMREADWLRDTPDGRRCKLYIAWLTEGTENDPTLKPDSKMAAAVNYLLAKVNEADPEPEPPTEPVGQPTIECPLCHGSGNVAASQTYTIVQTHG